MTRTLFRIFLVLGTYLAYVNGQDCVPKAVKNVMVSFRGILSWTVTEDETCQITHFMVHMSEPDQNARFIFKSFTTTLNVDFFFACDLWHFNIIPHVDETEGEGHLFITRIPVPMDANLALAFVNVSEGNGDPHLEWDMQNTFFGNCSLKYRVTMASDDVGEIIDDYTEERQMNLNFLSPCVNYEFGVRVINFAHPTMEGPMRSTYYDYPPAVQGAPTLHNVSQGATFVELNFALESTARNRCPIRELHVDGGKFFNFTVPLQDADERTPVEVRIDGLQANSMYVVRTAVLNNAGWSPYSFTAFQTLQLASNVVN